MTFINEFVFIDNSSFPCSDKGTNASFIASILKMQNP